MWIVAFVAAGLVVLAAADVFARPGGGQNFSGGGGGGGGGDDAFSYLAIMLIDLCVDDPAVGIPIAAVVIVVSIVWRSHSAGHRTRAAIEDLESEAFMGVQRSVEVLKDRDPGITEQGFLAEAAKMVVAVQNAWCSGDMRSARRLVSDGVFNRFTAQIAMNASFGFRNMMAESTIEAPAVAAVERDTHFDTIHVRIVGHARDADVPLGAGPEEAQKILRKAKRGRYVEVWSFLRKPGAQTMAGKSIVEGRCPNCGADQPVGDVVECPYCHALVNSGEHGWVLAEITQGSEWRPTSAGERIWGLAEMQALDPGFNRQQVEDRASFVFWKWIEARVTKNPAAVRKLSTPRMSDRVAREAAGGGIGGGRTAIRDVAVGSADLVAADPGPAGDVDRAYVRLRWSARYRKGAAPMPQTNVLVLVRKAGVVTRVGLSGDRCANCGAPTVTATDRPTCDYCGADLASGAQDFVLDEVAAPTAVVQVGIGSRAAARIAAAAREASPAPIGPAIAGGGAMMPMMMPMGIAGPAVQGPAIGAVRGGAGAAMSQPAPAPRPPVGPDPAVPSEAASPVVAPEDGEDGAGEPEMIPPWALPDMSASQERAALLFRMAIIAAADGVVTGRERRLIKKCAKRWAVPFDTVEPVLRTGVASLKPLQHPEDPRKFMTGLVAAALIDGKVDRKERRLLDGIAHNMGISPDTVSGLIAAMVEWRNRQAA